VAFILSPNRLTKRALSHLDRETQAIYRGWRRAVIAPAGFAVGLRGDYQVSRERAKRARDGPACCRTFREIQQAPFRELIGVFSKAAAAVGLLFQK
jgi:hypothetical protein